MSNMTMDRTGAFIYVDGDPTAPLTTASLTANLVCRVSLAVVANLVCLVPLKLLYRTGEFAAVIFILTVEVCNFETIVSSLVWHNDDVASWYKGYGLCDVDAYVHNAVIGLFSTCLMAIMRNLALQVGLLRAQGLTREEKRRRNITQAAIIFPFPVLQLALTWPMTAQRYLVGSLMGCSWIAYPAWPFLVFFVLPPPIFGLITATYAGLTYNRFRQVSMTTGTALSRNRTAQQRSQRTKRRLYMMVTSILVPFLPIVIALAVLNVLDMHGVRGYTYYEAHVDTHPFPWNTIMLIRSSGVSWTYLNNCYIAIFTALPIFLFFGMTKDAINSYRKVFLAMGFGFVFPKLEEEYDPDRRVGHFGSGGSSFRSNTLRMLASSPTKTDTLSGSTGRDSKSEDFRSPRFLRPFHDIQGPSPNLEAATNLFSRNPMPFRTKLNFSVPPVLTRLWGKVDTMPAPAPMTILEPSRSLSPLSLPHPDEISRPRPVHTRIWAGKRTSSNPDKQLPRKPLASGVRIDTTVETMAAEEYV